MAKATKAEKAEQAAEAKKALDAKKAAEAAAAQPAPEAETPEEVEEVVEEVKEVEETPKPVNGFLNPFLKGVTYDAFIKAVGKKKVEDYCKGKLEKHEIAWISEEVKAHKKNKINK